MPKIISAIALSVACITSAAVAHADTPKVGYVDVARAMTEVDEGKAAKSKLKGEFEAKQAKLDKMQESLQTKKADFEKKAAMMSPDAKLAKQEELQREYIEAQKYYMQVQQDLMESEKQFTQEIGRKLRTVIEKIGDRDGHFAILNTGDTVLYKKANMEITDEVIRNYNKQYPSTVSAPSNK